MKFLGALLLLIAILMLGPALFIWSINTMIIQSGLVSLATGTSAFFNPIPFNFWTWLASVFLGGLSIFGVIRK